MNKRKIVLLASALCMVAILAIGGTLAYFTDTQTKTNTFTVGNVKIELLESKLHRENAGVANGATSDSELWSNVNMEGSNNQSPYKAGDTFYTDAQIKADAKEYSCNNVKLAPGESYHKMPYVVNTGKNPAYIRIRMLFPAALDTAILNSSMYTTTALNNKEFTMEYVKSTSEEPIVRGDVVYNAYTFTRLEPLQPGEMTYWNVWGTVHMDDDVTNEEIADLVPNGTFSVLVEADAIQAEGFNTAEEAWAAFDAPKE